MKEQDRVGHLTESLGYVLKQSATALHLATTWVLRPFDPTVAPFSCP
ncbi:MarR family transcriptional regulator, partial [Lacisediminihabitans profunda]